MVYWYSDIEYIEQYATETGDNDFLNLSDDRKKLCLEYATKRIEKQINRPRQNGIIPYGYGSDVLREACKFVALDYARVIQQILANEKNRALSDSSYSDGVLNVKPADDIAINHVALLLIDDFIAENIGRINKNSWCRA